MITYHLLDPASNISLMGEVGPWQLTIIVIIAVLLFGGKKIPELMKGLGQGIKSFKDGMKEEDEVQKKDSSDKPA